MDLDKNYKTSLNEVPYYLFFAVMLFLFTFKDLTTHFNMADFEHVNESCLIFCTFMMRTFILYLIFIALLSAYKAFLYRKAIHSSLYLSITSDLEKVEKCYSFGAVIIIVISLIGTAIYLNSDSSFIGFCQYFIPFISFVLVYFFYLS